MAEPVAPLVEVVYATVDVQQIVTVAFLPGMTAGQAVETSALAAAFPEIRSPGVVLGIFGARVEPERLLRPGDRVEICRQLVLDPRDMRRASLAGGRTTGGAKSGAAK